VYSKKPAKILLNTYLKTIKEDIQKVGYSYYEFEIAECQLPSISLLLLKLIGLWVCPSV